MQKPEFAQLDPKIQEMFLTHLEAEANQVEQ
jgi:hypothetical protein